MTVQVVSAIQSAFNGLTKQTTDVSTNSPADMPKQHKSMTRVMTIDPKRKIRKGERIPPVQHI